MFELHQDAIFLGHDAEGMAVYGLEKNRVKLVNTKAGLTLDMSKVAKARADAEKVARMMGA